MRRNWVVPAVVALAAFVPACSGNGLSSLAAKRAGGSSTSAPPPRHVSGVQSIDLGPLDGAPLVLGSTTTDQVPIARVPIDGSRTAPVFELDVRSGRVEQLAPLPTRQYLADPQMVANSGGVVVSTTLCDQPPVPDSIGHFDCVAGDVAGWGLYLYRIEHGWRRIASGPQWPGGPSLGMRGDDVTVSANANPDSLTTLVGPRSVRQVQGQANWPGSLLVSDTPNGVSIDETTGRAMFSARPTATRSSLALSRLPQPFSQLAHPPSDIFDLGFFSSGPYLSSHAVDSTNPSLSTPGTLTVVDLRHPGARPRVFDCGGFVFQLISGTDYIGWEDADIHVLSPQGKVIADVPRHQAQSLTPARHGVVFLDDSASRSTPDLIVIHGT